MNPGRLRHRVNLQRKRITRDAYGEEAIEWTTYATVWAAIEPLQGQERFGAQQVKATTSHRVIIRYVKGVKAEDRVLYGSRALEINQVLNPDERNQQLTLICSEVID